jgi:hypothetical protein
MDALRELALLESRDVVTRRFQEVHGREPSAAKCRQIGAHVRQGREYWTSAEDAGDLIRPLLLYYASLAFCRALVLFSARRGGEEILSPSHGLRPVGWTAHIARNGVRGLLDLEIEVTSGTLGHLFTITGNREPSRLFIGPFPSIASSNEWGRRKPSRACV